MAWTGLTLTADGRSSLNSAQLSKSINFKSVVIGDGNPPDNYNTRKELVHQLYEITDLKLDITESGCTITADFPKVDFDYYFKEVGVIVSTDEGDKLYVYDNCGDDAQYIMNSTGVQKNQKRIRLSLTISDVDNITVSVPSILYVPYDEFEKTTTKVEDLISDMETLSNNLPAEIRLQSNKATAASTTNVDELTSAGIWYSYNKVLTGVPTELGEKTILALIKNETILNVTVQTLTTTSNGVISTWKRRWNGTVWGSWYKCINSNDMEKLHTMYVGVAVLGVTTESTITLSELFDLMDGVSEVTFFVSSSRYTGIYAEILAGIQNTYPNITSISAHVTIRKYGTTSYVTVEDYAEPSNKFETIYRSGVADNWVKYITTSDTESRRMYIHPSNFGCATSDTTLTLLIMINAMDAKSHVRFWVNNSGQYTSVYNEILAGIQAKYPEVTSIYGNVDIYKTDSSTVVTVYDYSNPRKVFTAHHSSVNSVGWSGWEKLITTSDIFVKSGSNAKAGLVPTPPATEGTSNFLREDATWGNPVSALFKTETFTFTLSVSAGEIGEYVNTLVTPYTGISYPEYLPVAVVKVDIGNDAILRGFGINSASNGGCSFGVKYENIKEKEITINGTVTVLWAKYGSI